MDYVLSAERQPKSVGFDSLRDEKGQSVRNIRRNMRQILQVKHYKMGEKINDDMNDLFELASRHTAISLMLATPTKIMKFQSPISQKLVREFKRTVSMFHSTKKSMCTKNFMFIGCILSEL